ncbi:MAG: hypothetical protein HY866_21880 [Chloroflexi bacterium]|nr:hypothetical protein [Chloroflexota bacterium]
MGDDVRMDFDAMEEMIKAFRRSASAMELVVDDVRKAAKIIEEGGCINEQGDRWVETLLTRIAPAFSNAVNGFDRVARDLDGALRDLRDGDAEARSRFSG